MEGSQEAELVTRLVLNGTVFMVRLAGQTAEGAAKLLTFLAAAAKSENAPGQKRLADLIRSGKPIQLFTLEAAQLDEFKAESKKYGIAYSIVEREDGTFDILVKEEDAVRINRVLENIAAVPAFTAEETDEQAEEVKSISDMPLSDIRELINRMMQPDERSVNPGKAADMKDSLSAASSMVADLPENERGSVAGKINEINTALENAPVSEKDAIGSLLQMMLENNDKPQEQPAAKEGLEEINEAFEKLMGSLNRSNPDKERR
ncbi:MAG: PcfB family protein [Clostridium sp.]|nr:PcfB family protein [Clostridium sp.]